MIHKSEKITSISLKLFLWILLTSIIFLSIFLFIAIGKASATTINVDDDDNADFTNIQDAIDAADNGDTIFVYDGNYTGNIVINKSVSLIGNETQRTTIIERNGDYAVTITADYVIIRNFRITSYAWPNRGDAISVQSNHCKIIGNDCEGPDYCINLQSSRNCTIENNSCKIVYDIYDYYGICIYLSSV